MVHKKSQLERATIFRSLHSAPLFVLANAWDVSSARIFELAGYQAIGTTSAGIAATLGYPDGQHIGVEATAEVVRRLVDHTNVPISADIEAGYSQTPEGVVQSAQAVLEAGAVGINIDDSTGDSRCPLIATDLQKERIRAIADMTSAEGVRLLINARTDVFLLSEEKGTDQLKSTIERANAYVEAGADCIFIPDYENMDKSTISTLVAEISAPVNIIAGSNTPSLSELKEMGVTRVSLGPRHMRATFALLKKIATEIMEDGTFSLMTVDTLSYSEVNEMFSSNT